MRFPRRRKVVIVSTPPTFTGERLCPLDQVPIGVLKLVSFLKNLGNTVRYVDLHDGIARPWKLKPAGRRGDSSRLVRVMGKTAPLLERELKALDLVPDEVWLSCTFTFDLDLAFEYLEVLRARWPGARLVLGGDSVRNGGAPPPPAGAEVFTGRIPEADVLAPDFSVRKKWGYGLFSLSIGCLNRCAFCGIWRDKPAELDRDAVLEYVKNQHRLHKPRLLWNWDPNPLMFGGALERFLDGYAAAGLGAGLCFGKGFQPNLLTEGLAAKLVKAGLFSATFPIESSSSKSEMLKPYTVISTVKALETARRAGFDLRHAQTTFMLGYPGEDLGSVFRSFSLSLAMGTTPTPFPVFLFPGTADFGRYGPLARRKGLFNLHGSLWPLLDDELVEKYDRLLKFLLSRDAAGVQENIGLLAPDLRDSFFREFDKSVRFAELAGSARGDSRQELARIEKEIAMKKIKGVKKLLHITASPRALGRSRTKHFAGHFLSRFLESYPRTQVTGLDVFKQGISFIGEEFIDYAFHRKDYKALSAKTRRQVDLAEGFIRQLEAADIVLISTPMWTLSIPSPLKAYFELVSTLMFYRHKRTFGKKLVFALLTREGNYPKQGIGGEGGSFINVQDATLEAICGFLGFGRPHFIRAENTRINEELPPELEAEIKAAINLSLRRTLNL